MIFELCKGFKLEGSLKVHNKQFQKVLEETTGRKYKDFSNKSDNKKNVEEEKDSQ